MCSIEIITIGFASALFSLNSFDQDTTPSKYSKQYTFDNIRIEVGEVEKYVSVNNRPPELLNHYSIKIYAHNTVISKEELLWTDRIVESWMSDLDQDKNFEISIHVRAAGSGSYGTLYFYEYNNAELVRHNIPELNSSLKKFYMGHDTFNVPKHVIEREFPAYNEMDANCCPSGGVVKIEYEFVNNQISEGSFSRQKPEKESEKAKRDFLLVIKSVAGLPNMDELSATDCWLQVFIGDRLIGETVRIQDNNSPQFNAQFEAVGYSGEVIRIKAFDKDVTKDEIIGETLIAKPESGVYPISYEAADGSIKKRGTVEVMFEK